MPVTITIQGASAAQAPQDLRAVARELRPQTPAEIAAARSDVTRDVFLASKSQPADGCTVPSDRAFFPEPVPADSTPVAEGAPSQAVAHAAPAEKTRRKRRTKAEMAAYRAALAAGGEPDPEVDESDDGEDEALQAEPQPAADASEAAAVAALFDAEPVSQSTDFSGKTVADCQELMGRVIAERRIAIGEIRERLVAAVKAPNLTSMDPALAPQAYAVLREIVDGSAS